MCLKQATPLQAHDSAPEHKNITYHIKTAHPAIAYHDMLWKPLHWIQVLLNCNVNLATAHGTW